MFDLQSLDLVLLAVVVQPLVVVVYGDRQHLLRVLLADRRTDRGSHLISRGRGSLLRSVLSLLFLYFFANDVVAQLDTFVADEDGGSGDQLADFVLALAAERAVEQLA